MSIETNRETLIQESDEEVVRRNIEERRKKKTPPNLMTAIEEVIEEWIRKEVDNAESERPEATETTVAQMQVTEDSHDNAPFHLKSKVNIGRTGSSSLRATIPEGIVAFLKLKVGDKLEWRMDIRDNNRVLVVKKVGEI